MKITLQTAKYYEELFEFSQNLPEGLTLLRIARRKKIFAVTLEGNNKNHIAECMIPTLQKIAMNENSVYRLSPKLREIANNYPKTTYINRLSGFLTNRKKINIDGYIIFGMAEYSDNLNMITYNLMKKFKLSF